MIAESSVKKQLAALSRNEISLEDFENWLLPEAWSMLRDSPPEAIDLVSSIHHLLDEYDDGVLSEAELRRFLLSFLDPVVSVSADWVEALISVPIPIESSDISSLAQFDVDMHPIPFWEYRSSSQQPVLLSARV